MSQKHAWKGKTIKGILHVAIGNILKVISGIVVGFMLPKLLSVNDYGLYKTCTLYAAYVGLFSTGIIDGVALRFGGYAYEQLPKADFRRYTRVFLLLELLIALCFASVSFFLPAPAPLVLLYLSVFLLNNNITAYFQTLSQCTQRFGELSLFNAVHSVFTVLSVLLLWIGLCMGLSAGVRYYIVISSAMSSAVTVLYLVRYRQIINGHASPFRQVRKDLYELIRHGVPLMVANLCSLLLLSIDRQFVNVLFQTETYAVYAFAYNIVTMLTMVISAVSTVLYPTLKRMHRDDLSAGYVPLMKNMIMVAALCIMLYFPLKAFIPWFLPLYTESLETLRIILPGLLCTSVTTIIIHNYYKTLGLNLRFCLQGLAMLVLSILADLAAYHFFGTTNAISYASLIVLIIWWYVSDRTISRFFTQHTLSCLISILLIMAVFEFASACFNWLGGLAVYCGALMALYLLLFRSRQKQDIKE